MTARTDRSTSLDPPVAARGSRGLRRRSLVRLAVTAVLLAGVEAAGDDDVDALVWLEAVRPAGDPVLLEHVERLGYRRFAEGAYDEARRLLERCEEALAEDLGPSHLPLLKIRIDLAVVTKAAGDAATAATLEELALSGIEVHAYAPDEPVMIVLHRNLVDTYSQLGRTDDAERVARDLIRGLREALPDDDPRLDEARSVLASVLGDSGRIEEALELMDSVLRSQEAALDEDDPELQTTRMRFARLAYLGARYEDSRRAYERALAAHLRRLPPTHPDVLNVQQNLALALLKVDGIVQARTLLDRTLAALEEALPDDHPQLSAARENLGVVLLEMGDHEAARHLLERAHDGFRARFPDDHPSVRRTRASLGTAWLAAGDHDRALHLQEDAVEACRRALAPDDEELLVLETHLAILRRDAGDVEEALVLAEGVLERRLAARPDDVDAILYCRYHLASILARLGRMAEAEAQFLEVERATAERPDDETLGLDARSALAMIELRRGHEDAARERLSRIARGLRRALQGWTLLSRRQVDALLLGRSRHLSTFLDLAPEAGIDPREGLALVESARALRSRPPLTGARTADDPALEAMRREVLLARQHVQDLVVGRVGADAAALGDAGRRRDEAERRLRLALAERGSLTGTVDAESIVKQLPPRTAAVSYWRYVGELGDEPHLLAHVVRADGHVARVDLGRAADLEEAVARWRRALGAPVDAAAEASTHGADASRGVSGLRPEPSGDDERAAGDALRTAVLDPVLRETGDASTLLVALDDVLHLVPLDALPAAEGRIGDRWRIRVRTSFETSFETPAANGEAADALGVDSSRPRLVAIGGIEYGAAPDAGDSAFRPLAHTRAEVSGIAAAFSETVGGDVTLLTGADATKAAFDAEVPRADWLHLATHGTFAGGRLALLEPAAGPPDLRATFAEAVSGMAPMALCGLALAGANLEPDALGRVAGIVTAEELAALDLSRCRLAVLSACETALGQRRAGLSVQSLQTALHAAGARASITALWGVRDQATRDLMLELYRRLWVEHEPLDVALWEAKRTLRAAGRPPFDWAGFVLAER